MSQVTANGNTYSDDGTSALNMQNGGHRTHLLPMLADVIEEAASIISVGTGDAAAASVSASASAASAAAASASVAAASAIVLGVATGYPKIRPTLNIDFANSKAVDPRITYTRASAASYTDSDGLIKSAATNAPRFDHDPITGECKGLLIEEARSNLLTYSENFDNAAWSKLRCTVTPNAIEAPDGTVTADKLVEDTSVSLPHYVYVIKTGSNSAFTFSVYVKAAERTEIRVGMSNSLNEACVAVFNIATASITSYNSTDGADFKARTCAITPVANGWVRCSITANKQSVNTTVSCEIQLFNSVLDYTGNGTSGIYIWGAQLETGTLSSYIPSTDTFTSRASTATYTGSDGLLKTAAINEARMQYNPLNLKLAPKLLLEAAATNLLTYSEQSDNAAWTKISSSITANATTAPDGTNTADKIIINNGSPFGCKYIPGSIQPNTTYTLSFYAKAGERTVVVPDIYTVETGDVQVTVNLLTGVITSPFGSPDSYGAVSVGNGWYRVWITKTFGATVTNSKTQVGRIQVTGDDVSGLYLWGAQLEASSYPTSYIPTTTTAITRSADVSTSSAATRAADLASMTGSNFSDWYSPTEGTFVAEFTYGTDLISTAVLTATDSTATNSILITGSNSGGIGPYGQTVVGGVEQAIMTDGTAVANTTYRAAVAYKANDFGFSRDGRAVVTDASGTIPSVTQLFIGRVQSVQFFNGNISKISYYPKCLTNLQLQALSTR